MDGRGLDMKGKLITIEGGDGSGKSTQIARLREALSLRGIDALFLREPGDTAIGETLRQVILNPQNTEMCPETETLLYAASRAQLAAQVMVPALAAGRLVICDRYVDSSVAYQGFGRELGADYVLAVNRRAWEMARPDRTIYLELTPEQGLKRKTGQQALDRLEEAGAAFHRRVFDGYRWLCSREPERFRVINAALSPEEVHAQVLLAVEELL